MLESNKELQDKFYNVKNFLAYLNVKDQDGTAVLIDPDININEVKTVFKKELRGSEKKKEAIIKNLHLETLGSGLNYLENLLGKYSNIKTLINLFETIQVVQKREDNAFFTPEDYEKNGVDMTGTTKYLAYDKQLTENQQWYRDWVEMHECLHATDYGIQKIFTTFQGNSFLSSFLAFNPYCVDFHNRHRNFKKDNMPDTIYKTSLPERSLFSLFAGESVFSAKNLEGPMGHPDSNLTEMFASVMNSFLLLHKENQGYKTGIRNKWNKAFDHSVASSIDEIPPYFPYQNFSIGNYISDGTTMDTQIKKNEIAGYIINPYTNNPPKKNESDADYIKRTDILLKEAMFQQLILPEYIAFIALVIETLETAQKNLIEIVEDPKKFIPQKIPKDYQALNAEDLLRAHVSIEGLRNFLTEVHIDLTSKKN